MSTTPVVEPVALKYVVALTVVNAPVFGVVAPTVPLSGPEKAVAETLEANVAAWFVASVSAVVPPDEPLSFVLSVRVPSLLAMNLIELSEVVPADITLTAPP